MRVFGSRVYPDERYRPRFRRVIWSQEKLMNPLLEMDFAMQQQTLRRLRDQRKNLPNGSEDTDNSEVKIIAAENLILSYETLKYYELESRLGLQTKSETHIR